MKAILFATVTSLASFAFAQPSSFPLDGQQARAIVAKHMPQTGWALSEAGISSRAKATGGVSTRFGGPGNYSDVIVITMASCGPTPTSPCRVEGCLNITIKHRGNRQQAIINASAQCR